MEIRKIQVAGAGDTRIISLPKEWAEKVKAEKGTNIIVKELSNGDLLLYPQSRAKKRPKRYARIIESSDIQRDILGAYLSGYEIINVYSSKKGEPLNFKNTIRELSRQLIGLEILGETVDSIELHFLIDSAALPDPRKYLRRCFSIASQMCEDVVKAFISGNVELAEEVELRDTEVNRLYFLIVRMLKIMVNDKREESVIKPQACLDWRMIAAYSETIGDRSVDFAREIKNHPEFNTYLPPNILEAIDHMNILTKQSLDESLEIFMVQDVQRSRELRKRIENVNIVKLHEISREISKLDKQVVWGSSALIQLFLILNERAIDIVDLVIANDSNIISYEEED